MSKERLAKVNELLERYYDSEDGFEQTDLAINIIQGHVDWLVRQAERADKLEFALNVEKKHNKINDKEISRLKSEKETLMMAHDNMSRELADYKRLNQKDKHELIKANINHIRKIEELEGEE